MVCLTLGNSEAERSETVAIHSEAVWTGPFTLNWTKPNEMVWFGLGRLK